MVERAQRLEKDRTCRAKKRAPETILQMVKRQKNSRTCLVKNRVLVVPMEKCIADFQSKIKQHPDFVCTCCHRMMYKETVDPYATSKYSSELLEQVFSTEHSYDSSDGRHWIC